jgi:hypothetical protein
LPPEEKKEITSMGRWEKKIGAMGEKKGHSEDVAGLNMEVGNFLERRTVGLLQFF